MYLYPILVQKYFLIISLLIWGVVYSESDICNKVTNIGLGFLWFGCSTGVLFFSQYLTKPSKIHTHRRIALYFAYSIFSGASYVFLNFFLYLSISRHSYNKAKCYTSDQDMTFPVVIGCFSVFLFLCELVAIAFFLNLVDCEKESQNARITLDEIV